LDFFFFFDNLVESTLLAGGKIKKKDEKLGDSARGQADPGSAAVYTMEDGTRSNPQIYLL
jgi:hypothetical protein